MGGEDQEVGDQRRRILQGMKGSGYMRARARVGYSAASGDHRCRDTEWVS